MRLRAPLIETNTLKSLAAFATQVAPTLYRLPSLIRKLGGLAEAGFRRVLDHFDFRRMGKRYVQLFSSLLKENLAVPDQRTAPH